MQNTYSTPTDFWKERDFGTKISAVFEFIGQHWRPLGKCLVYFVLPVALLLGIGLGLLTNSFYNQLGGVMAAKRPGVFVPQPDSPFGAFSFTGFGLAMIGGLLSFIMLTGTLLGYLRARLRLPAAEPVTPAAVWVEMRARLGRMVLVLVLLGATYLALVFGAVLLAASLKGFNPGGGTIGTLVLTFFLTFVVAIYLSIVLSLYFPILWLEEQSVFGAVGRCFQLIKGQWWATLGLLLVVGLLQGVLGVVFAIPQYAVIFGKAMQLPGLNSDVLGIVAQTFYATGTTLMYCLPLLALVFQYFNLAEQQEGHGLRLLVDQLGQPAAAPTAHSAHYRPDEEGEY